MLKTMLDKPNRKKRSIENRLIGLNEVEVVGVFVVVLEGKDEKWGGNLWGKE